MFIIIKNSSSQVKLINAITFENIWPRGGMVTQRTANPCIPVRFWAWPPL